MPEEFIVSKIPCFNFEGSGEAQAREQVLHRLLARIEVVVVAKGPDTMAVEEDFPFLPPPQREPSGQDKRP